MVKGLLRQRNGGHAAVSNLELFFDLVYVFAITQIAQFMHSHLGLIGLVEAVIVFLAVWWAWIFTSWSTNWADPETVPVRLMMMANMLASLVLAALLPRAFDGVGHATAFALTYGLVQIGRTLFMLWTMAEERPAGARNMLRIACWFIAAFPLWLIGARIGTTAGQITLWAVALAIEYAGPFAFFRVPGLGRSTDADWDIAGGHLAERASLFVLIALGEGIVETGAAFAESSPTLPRVLAFLACFAGSVLMWWIYFDMGATRGAQHIAHSPEAGRIARNAYTYLHLPIVASVIVTAVADTLLMEAPDALASPALVAACGGGLIVYLGGMALFKRFSSPLGNLPLSHLVGLALLGALIAAGHALVWSAVAFTGACALVLLLVAVWEWGSFHGGWQERLEQRRAG